MQYNIQKYFTGYGLCLNSYDHPFETFDTFEEAFKTAIWYAENFGNKTVKYKDSHFGEEKRVY